MTKNNPDEILNYIFENMDKLEEAIKQKESSMTCAFDEGRKRSKQPATKTCSQPNQPILKHSGL